MVAGRFTNETQDMLAEIGFEPCWVRDISSGDTIMIEHEIDRDVPTEMVVESLHSTRFTEYTAYQWIGVLMNGSRKVHCSFGGAYPCWKLKVSS